MNADAHPFRLHRKLLSVFICVHLWLTGFTLSGAEHHGTVKFGGLPVPGATISAKKDDKMLTAVTDQMGAYTFPDLTDGTWNLRIEMSGFSPIEREVVIAPNAPEAEWDLKMLSFDEIKVTAPPPAPAPPVVTKVEPPAPTQTPAKARSAAKGKATAKNQPPATGQAFQRADLNSTNAAPAPPAKEEAPASQDVGELSQRAADGFLINGSNNNGASSPFALAPAFGNNRRGVRSLYNGNLGVTVDNSGLDARQYSLTGQDTLKPAYDNFNGFATFGGPIKIPHLIRNGPNFFVAYQWLRTRANQTLPGLMPTEAERNGDLSAIGGPIIPPSQISPQARALLNLYPLPNFDGGARYNYQIANQSITHQDSLQARLNKTIGRKNQISGLFGLQSKRTDTPNLFNFVDTGNNLGWTSQVNWRHNFTQRFNGNFGAQFSRQSVRVTPYFANRENIAGEAGITGNNQDPLFWGPPTLNFSSGISALTDTQYSFTRTQTAGVSADMLWNHGPHNIAFGGDFKRQEFNYLSQQDPRGVFTFTGTTFANGDPTAVFRGADFASFLLGIPDTSQIAFGNADKYFRASIHDAYVQDDWRMTPSFTLQAGLRWEYWSPITELYGRLVNLDIAPGFTAAMPVVANDPVGPVTGQRYPASLVNPDKHAFQPRVGFSWRPFPASSMVVRGGYGIYYNTSVYQAIAVQMAQQAPLSKSLSVAYTADNPLTLANGFNAIPGTTQNTFAIDPNFRIGYTQNWQLSVQRDLPAALVGSITYLGIKGTRGAQEFLPNTYPTGAVNPCLPPSCPTGFIYLTSNGNSTRESAQFQLRRRLHNGFTANLSYTFSKSIDDSSLGGRSGTSSGQSSYLVAQNWLDLAAERALSVFDQRHLATIQLQYTSGMGVGGGALVNGWRGALFKEWTFLTQITVGSGLPLTPTFPRPILGTGVTGPERPDYTGAPLSGAPGLNVNPAAFTAPAPGQWGNAGRDSITGPSQFGLNASLQRTFRVSDRISADFRIDATNALNHVTFPSWVTSVGSAQFGLPLTANAMRDVQTTVRLRF